MKKLLAFLIVFWAFSFVSLAQTTKVCGKVVNASTGEPLQYVGVFFENSEIGTTTNQDGSYSLETRDTSLRVVKAELLGYQPVVVIVSSGTQSNCNFMLKPLNEEIKGSFVKADNRRIKAFLAAFDAAKAKNNPDSRPKYACNLYNKMELDLPYSGNKEGAKKFLKDMGFVLDYIGTCDVNGVQILPVMISETFARREHLSDPSVSRETIEANRFSGINPDNNLLAPFTGSLRLSANFYRSYINAFGVEFPSPAQSKGLLFYDYYFVDSLQIDGRKTYVIRFHPKRGNVSPSLDGEMRVDADEYALRSVRAKMKRGGNVNWLRGIEFDTRYRRMADSSWFFEKEKLFVDFALTMIDSTSKVAFFGTRTIEYLDPDFDAEIESDLTSDVVKVAEQANGRDENYWETVRPSALEPREEKIFKMVDQVQETSFYQVLYGVSRTVVSGYYEAGPVELGPYYKVISYNNLEGLRLQFGGRTNRNFSKNHRIGLFAAYGFKDHKWKGGATYEWMIDREPTCKLSVDVRRDMYQLGKTDNIYTEGNILASVFSKSNSQKLCEQDLFSMKIEKEITPSFSIIGGASLKRYYSNAYVTMSESIPSVATNELQLAARLSWDEIVSRGLYKKTYVYNRYPVVLVGLVGSMSGLRKNDFKFLRPEITIDWKANLTPLGISKIHVNAGAIIGKVPYPLLHIHEGNGTFILDKKSFACLDYFEFASDKWATLMWNHSFNGLLLGRIPYVRDLKLREEFTLKAAYGTLSERNRNAFFAFPQGMSSMGNVPYVEVGAGISNILSLFRVDCFWRLTHREGASHKFVVNAGLELRF